MNGPVGTERHGDIALVWIDNPPVNALSQAVRQGIVDGLDAAIADGVKAVVLAGRGGTFIAGADIREFGKPPMEPHLGAVCDRLEAASVPVVAAIQGNTLGGGLEVALGCHYRVAEPGAKIGLPEVNLGLIPGAAGTQRAPRAIGDVGKAVDFVSSGKPVSGEAAKALGLVDEVADDAVTGALALAERVAGSDPAERRLSSRTMEPDATAFDEAMAKVRKAARGADAPVAAAEMVRLAYTASFAEGVKAERETFVRLMQGDQSAALRSMFFAERQSAKPPVGVTGEPRAVQRVGVIGAGTMGGGIAMTYAAAGIPVTLVEQAQDALDAGVARMKANWERGLKSGRTTPEGVAANMARLTPTTDFDALADCDLIIEAVFETMAVKKDVFTRLDRVAKPGAVLATNTSYLDIDEIAAVTSRPHDVVGMHYFSPANIMKLLEIVRAQKTADDVLLTALAMAKRTGKVAVVAGVGHGFIGNRLLTPYLRQANLLVLEGASPAQVDRALTDFGYAMGPFAVSDLAGLDIGYKSRQDQDLTEAERGIYAVADALVEAGHLGQKSGSGFYAYDAQTRARADSAEAAAIIERVRAERGINARAISDEEIVERTQFALANEGAHVLSEGVAQRASDIDVVYVHGYGYPRWRGGPMHHAAAVGLDRVAKAVEGYADGPAGEHWNPSDLLMSAAAEGKSLDETAS